MDQLRELQDSRQIIVTYEDFITREREQDQKERDNWQKSVDLEKQRTDLAKKETALEKERAELYLNLYNACKKKPGGFKCFLKRFFTAGLARC